MLSSNNAYRKIVQGLCLVVYPSSVIWQSCSVLMLTIYMFARQCSTLSEPLTSKHFVESSLAAKNDTICG